jgi:G patch domain/KOW motif-containing protein
VYDDDDKDRRKGEFKNRGDAYSGDRHKRKQEGNEAKESYERRKDDEPKKSQRSTSKDTKEELKPVAKAAQSWLTRDIRVKVIHKTEYGGKWYLQKGCIVDVVSPNICDVRMDDGGKILQDVKEEHLETALPKGGGRVLVVGGKLRGQIGRLQERIPDKGVGIVQIDETYELFTLDLDHLAEYVGVNHELEG